MHFKRLAIALILLPLFYLYVTKLSELYFLFLLMAGAALAQYEFYSMYRVERILKYSGMILGGATAAAAYFSRNHFGQVIMLSFLAIAVIRLFIRRNPFNALRDAAPAMFAIVYIPGLLSYLLYLREQGAGWIIFLFGCVWASDSLAYYAGSSIGKRKLYEEVSPKKTVAGAAGSIAGGAIGAVILKYLFAAHTAFLSMSEAVVLGAIVGTVSVIGDLVESMFKRDAGVKDSGNLLPGHGGMLDKIDSLLFAGPVLYWVSVGLRLIK